VGILAAWVLATFTLATLHTSPMPKDAFSGKLVYDVPSASMLTQPDVAWLRFFEKKTKADAFGSNAKNEFSAELFVKIYADHRDKFEKAPTFIVKREGT
jgi:hypothetical protein